MTNAKSLGRVLTHRNPYIPMINRYLLFSPWPCFCENAWGGEQHVQRGAAVWTLPFKVLNDDAYNITNMIKLKLMSIVTNTNFEYLFGRILNLSFCMV